MFTTSMTVDFMKPVCMSNTRCLIVLSLQLALIRIRACVSKVLIALDQFALISTRHKVILCNQSCAGPLPIHIVFLIFTKSPFLWSLYVSCLLKTYRFSLCVIIPQRKTEAGFVCSLWWLCVTVGLHFSSVFHPLALHVTLVYLCKYRSAKLICATQ